MFRAASATPLPSPAGSGGRVAHGGNLAAAAARFPGAPGPWLDLSTGINPHAYPLGEVPASAWSRLPEPADQEALEAAAARAYGARTPDAVVAAPGTQALIQALPRLWPAARVAVLGFTYAEHAAAWAACGASVRSVGSLDELGGAEVAVVVNPNNPDGCRVPPGDLTRLAGRLAARGGLLIVDEAFAEAGADAGSLVPGGLPAGAVVLRSFGKFYGLAGLRLGFAVAASDRADALRAALGPWAVSGPAILVGRRALDDAAWRAETAVRLHEASGRLDGLLARAGLRPLGGTALFRLAESAEAARWFERLGRAGILVRAFPERPAWLRFGLPGPEADWARLAAVLAP